VFDLSPTKLIIVFVVGLFILGPKRLPQVAHQVGAGWRRLRDMQHQLDQEVRKGVPGLPTSQEIVRYARSPSALLDRFSDSAINGRDALVKDPSAPSPLEVDSDTVERSGSTRAATVHGVDDAREVLATTPASTDWSQLGQSVADDPSFN
jgi:hypothetical protein